MWEARCLVWNVIQNGNVLSVTHLRWVITSQGHNITYTGDIFWLRIWVFNVEYGVWTYSFRCHWSERVTMDTMGSMSCLSSCLSLWTDSHPVCPCIKCQRDKFPSSYFALTLWFWWFLSPCCMRRIDLARPSVWLCSLHRNALLNQRLFRLKVIIELIHRLITAAECLYLTLFISAYALCGGLLGDLFCVDGHNSLSCKMSLWGWITWTTWTWNVVFVQESTKWSSPLNAWVNRSRSHNL